MKSASIYSKIASLATLLILEPSLPLTVSRFIVGVSISNQGESSPLPKALPPANGRALTEALKKYIRLSKIKRLITQVELEQIAAALLAESPDGELSEFRFREIIEENLNVKLPETDESTQEGLELSASQSVAFQSISTELNSALTLINALPSPSGATTNPTGKSAQSLAATKNSASSSASKSAGPVKQKKGGSLSAQISPEEIRKLAQTASPPTKLNDFTSDSTEDTDTPPSPLSTNAAAPLSTPSSGSGYRPSASPNQTTTSNTPPPSSSETSHSSNESTGPRAARLSSKQSPSSHASMPSLTTGASPGSTVTAPSATSEHKLASSPSAKSPVAAVSEQERAIQADIERGHKNPGSMPPGTQKFLEWSQGILKTSQEQKVKGKVTTKNICELNPSSTADAIEEVWERLTQESAKYNEVLNNSTSRQQFLSSLEHQLNQERDQKNHGKPPASRVSRKDFLIAKFGPLLGDHSSNNIEKYLKANDICGITNTDAAQDLRCHSVYFAAHKAAMPQSAKFTLVLSSECANNKIQKLGLSFEETLRPLVSACESPLGFASAALDPQVNNEVAPEISQLYDSITSYPPIIRGKTQSLKTRDLQPLARLLGRSTQGGPLNGLRTLLGLPKSEEEPAKKAAETCKTLVELYKYILVQTLEPSYPATRETPHKETKQKQSGLHSARPL